MKIIIKSNEDNININVPMGVAIAFIKISTRFGNSKFLERYITKQSTSKKVNNVSIKDDVEEKLNKEVFENLDKELSESINDSKEDFTLNIDSKKITSNISTNMKFNDIANEKNVKNLTKALKYLNKKHKGLVLVDIEDESSGEIVKIIV